MKSLCQGASLALSMLKCKGVVTDGGPKDDFDEGRPEKITGRTGKPEKRTSN
jgi:hypothetical protein